MKILIAEDDPVFCHFLEEMLVKWEYTVTAVGDGKEAWQALQVAEAPQIAILDWLMPEMDGVELCRRIRQERPEPYTYIILLTSQQREEDLITGMEAGADDYITKPFKTGELQVRLKAGQRVVEMQNELVTRAAELEVANRDLESFSYTVANDLLKSLLSIGENARAIQDLYCSKQNEQCHAYTRRIYEKTKSLGNLIGVMNDFFRPTRTELRRERLDLGRMASEVAETLRLGAPERKVVLRVAAGIEANADPNLLRTVLQHLLENAWKHTAACEMPVVEFGETTIEGRSAFYVRDNGTGFDPAHAERLFRPFQPLPGSERLAGQGIGLATVERIVRRHGGKVWAEGEPGKGATFYFSL